MPALPDPDPAIQSPAGERAFRPAHPSPTIDGLALEVRSPKEQGWWGQRFGIDTPYYYEPLGWGEWAPLVDT